MFRHFLAILLLAPFILQAQVISIANAHNTAVGTTVTVRGIVTNGAELGKIRYMQDQTAGIAAFPGTGSAAGFENAVTLGDSITVTGTLVSYQGLLEISPITAYTVLAHGLPLPAPKHLNINAISEDYESQLVGFECVSFAAGGGQFSSGTYVFSDDNGSTAEAYLRAGHPLIGANIPGTPTLLTGILSQYTDFQLLPRTTSDFNESYCFYFIDPVAQTSINTTNIPLFWSTNLAATATIRYGTSPDALTSMATVTSNTTNQTYNLSGLQPGTVYWVQVETVSNGTVLLSKKVPFATRSTSSGQTKVFFTRAIDPASANGYTPDGQTAAAVLAETIARINAATQTLDVAMYNNSRDDITNALTEAHNRGVRVRYIAALDATNGSLSPAPPFPVLYGNDVALMHNKFIVADADLSDKAWIMSGSLNWTNQSIYQDFNNTLFIQDQSLARTYRIEFEEMWGGSEAQPLGVLSRFGADKTDNTPHRFIVNGFPVESWFSPSDHTTQAIVNAVHTANSEALFAAYSFTQNDIGDALVDVHNSNGTVRGMIENVDDIGCELDNLVAFDIDCRAHPLAGNLHHKYGIFDPNGSDPTLVTGSHNWTFAAETANDENTLVLHDPRLTSLYKAEFEKRWQENTPSSTSYSVENQNFIVFPNPAFDILNISLPEGENAAIEIRDAYGRVCLGENITANGNSIPVVVSALTPGFYFVIIRSKNAASAVPFQKIQH